jgi:hypothetical protein
MARRLSDRGGCLVLLAFLFVPGFLAAYFLHSRVWLVGTPAVLVILMLVVAALPIKRKTTPQQWADELEKHLLGTDGAYGWDDATSVTLADERLENLRSRLIPDFDLLNTPEKREELRQIIEALRRGQVP